MNWVLGHARQLVVFVLVTYWLIIALGTHVPTGELHAPGRSDLALHFTAYAGLAFLLAWSVMRRRPTLAKTVAVVAVCVVYGGLDEVTQSFVPTRHADVGDWVADCLGTLVGMAGYFGTWRLVRPRAGWKVVAWDGKQMQVHDAA